MCSSGPLRYHAFSRTMLFLSSAYVRVVTVERYLKLLQAFVGYSLMIIVAARLTTILPALGGGEQVTKIIT